MRNSKKMANKVTRQMVGDGDGGGGGFPYSSSSIEADVTRNMR